MVRAHLGAPSRTGVIGPARCRELRHLAGRRPLWLLKLRQRCCRGLPHAPSTSRPRHLSVSHGRAGRLQPRGPYPALAWRYSHRDEPIVKTLASLPGVEQAARHRATMNLCFGAGSLSLSLSLLSPILRRGFAAKGRGRRGVRRARSAVDPRYAALTRRIWIKRALGVERSARYHGDTTTSVLHK